MTKSESDKYYRLHPAASIVDDEEFILGHLGGLDLIHAILSGEVKLENTASVRTLLAALASGDVEDLQFLADLLALQEDFKNTWH